MTSIRPVKLTRYHKGAASCSRLHRLRLAQLHQFYSSTCYWVARLTIGSACSILSILFSSGQSDGREILAVLAAGPSDWVTGLLFCELTRFSRGRPDLTRRVTRASRRADFLCNYVYPQSWPVQPRLLCTRAVWLRACGSLMPVPSLNHWDLFIWEQPYIHAWGNYPIGLPPSCFHALTFCLWRKLISSRRSRME